MTTIWQAGGPRITRASSEAAPTAPAPTIPTFMVCPSCGRYAHYMARPPLPDMDNYAANPRRSACGDWQYLSAKMRCQSRTTGNQNSFGREVSHDDVHHLSELHRTGR